MKIISMLPILAFGDAVGNDTIAVHNSLKKAGYDSMIVASVIDGRLGDGIATSADDLSFIKSEDIVIYHLSTGQVYKRNNWPLEIPLNPLFTFDKMDMASNRFAHATAMSVIDNIGTMHNPFMVYGDSGTGKTHFLNAMGYELAMKIGQEKIFFTNGVRFSRGVQRYVEEGNMKHLEDFFSSVEVLIIDDIHLTAVNEHNREFISRVLNRFLQEKKQILISSKYPPESLARFEELVRFRLDQGWVSELKHPRQQHFSKIYARMMEDAELGLNDVQSQGFLNFDKVNLGSVARNIKRAKVLSRRINNSGLIQMSHEQILNEMLAVNGENENSEIVKKDFADIVSINRSENTDWSKLEDAEEIFMEWGGVEDDD